jgi:hypothetical protein
MCGASSCLGSCWVAYLAGARRSASMACRHLQDFCWYLAARQLLHRALHTTAESAKQLLRNTLQQQMHGPTMVNNYPSHWQKQHEISSSALNFISRELCTPASCWLSCANEDQYAHSGIQVYTHISTTAAGTIPHTLQHNHALEIGADIIQITTQLCEKVAT